MPRRKIAFKTVPGSGVRYIDDCGGLLFVAVDIARGMGYPSEKAAKTTATWRVREVQIMLGRKEWRMMTLEDVRLACWRSRQPRATEFMGWLEYAAQRLG